MKTSFLIVFVFVALSGCDRFLTRPTPEFRSAFHANSGVPESILQQLHSEVECKNSFGGFLFVGYITGPKDALASLLAATTETRSYQEPEERAALEQYVLSLSRAVGGTTIFTLPDASTLKEHSIHTKHGDIRIFSGDNLEKVLLVWMGKSIKSP